MEGEMVPDLVQQFVVYLYRHIRERNLHEIYTMYDNSWNKLSDRYFKTKPWPTVETVSHLVNNDHVFCLLYREMYHRHLCTKRPPTLQQRADSWETYCSLFDIILNSDLNMLLPNVWLWDMVDEFVYQFQSFCQFRGKLQTKKPEELEFLAQNSQIWSALGVFNYLQALVDKSKVLQQLAEKGDAFLLETENYTAHTATSNVLPVLGYLALVGLLRMHTLLGDYHGGLQAVKALNLDHANTFVSKIARCHISAHYHTGFCLMMLRRYRESTSVVNEGLVFVGRVKQYLSKSAGYDLVLQKMEQMYAMLAIAVGLSPAGERALEESVSSNLAEKHREKIQRMQREAALQTYEDLFTYCCPKFVTAGPPDYSDVSKNVHQEAYKLQLKMFLKLVHQDPKLPVLRQYLKLYTSIPLVKLASLMDMPVESLEKLLLALKTRSRDEGDAGEGTVGFSLDVDAASGETVVQVADDQAVKHTADFFLRHIAKMDSITQDLKKAGSGMSIATS
tara:strand:+ start:75 stop:1589 length:1515 start_codon:yes stop_codon:yes gene_type:complete